MNFHYDSGLIFAFQSELDQETTCRLEIIERINQRMNELLDRKQIADSNLQHIRNEL